VIAFPSRGQKLAPAWLRPSALALVVALHGTVLWGLPASQPPPLGLAPTVEISIVPEGDAAREIASPGSPNESVEAMLAAPDATASPAQEPAEAQPAEPPAAVTVFPPPTEMSPVPPGDAPQPEPVVPAPEALTPLDMRPVDAPPAPSNVLSPVPEPVPARPAARQQPKRAADTPRPKPQQPRVDTSRLAREQERSTERMREATRRAREAQRTDEPARIRASAAASPERPGSVTAARGIPAGGGGSRQATASIASGAYAAQVRALLQARANALGLEDVEGVVGVIFEVGPSGRLLSHRVARPSGNYVIDRAIGAMLSSMQFPPPPGGSFSGDVSVRVR
jgi:protein TonB